MITFFSFRNIIFFILLYISLFHCFSLFSFVSADQCSTEQTCYACCGFNCNSGETCYINFNQGYCQCQTNNDLSGGAIAGIVIGIIVFIVILCLVILCWFGYCAAATRPGYMPGQIYYGKPAGTPGTNANIPYATAYTPYDNTAQIPYATQPQQQFAYSSNVPLSTNPTSTATTTTTTPPSVGVSYRPPATAPMNDPPPDYSPQREYVDVTKSISGGTTSALPDAAQVSNSTASNGITTYPTAGGYTVSGEPMKI